MGILTEMLVCEDMTSCTSTDLARCHVVDEIRPAERIIGPWGSFNFGPLVYLPLYMLCCMKALVL